MKSLKLDGYSLSINELVAAASNLPEIQLGRRGIARMKKSRLLVDEAIRNQIPVYGVTTGLGSRVGEALSEKELSEFSYQTIRGRAQAIGKPVSNDIVRAAMIVRANTLLQGAGAASPQIAQHYVNCLNEGITPVVGEFGSIGAGDLVWNATTGLSLIGKGEMMDNRGHCGQSYRVMKKAGVEIPTLGPRDGLAICNHASYSAAHCALAHQKAGNAYHAAQTAAALSLEGFRANLTPFDTRVLALRPQPGQAQAAGQIMTLLHGSDMHDIAKARRLQDPLSIRNIPQVHGATQAALDFASQAIVIEINGASDNPVALVDDNVIISAGAYHTPHLTNVIETVARSFVHLSMAQLARISKMLSPRFTDLTAFLAFENSVSNGFAPLMKTAESVVSELVHAASPTPIWPSINADGVEDSLTNTPAAAKALTSVAENSIYLSSIEMLIACRAIELRGTIDTMGKPMTSAYNQIRKLSAQFDTDRPLTNDIMALADWIQSDKFARC